MSRLNHWTALRQRKISRRTMLGASAKAGVGAAGLALVGCGDDDEPDAGAVAAERAAAAAEEAAAAAVAAGDARAAESEAAAAVAAGAADAAADAAAAAGEASAAAGEASDAAAQAASAADAAAALAAEAAESEDAANAAAAAEAAAAAAADAAAAASAAGDQAAAAVAAAASEAAEAAAQAARDAAAAVEAGTATAAAAQAAIDEAAEAAAAAAAAAGEASAAAGQAAATAAETAATAAETAATAEAVAEAAAETAAAAVAAAQEAADAAQEAAESAAMAAEEDEAVGHVPMGEVRLPWQGNFSGTEGTTGTSGADHWMLWSIYDNLVGYDTTLTPDPARSLAQSWEVPDELTVVFNLRDNVQYHDGTPLSAESVRLHMERGKTLEVSRIAGDLGALDTVEEVDGLTATFHMSRPFSPLLWILGDRAGMLLSPAVFDDFTEALTRNAPSATGAFKFVEEDLDSPFIVEANRNYWLPNAPSVERITYLQSVEAGQATNGLIAGDYDIQWRPSAEDFPRMEDAGLTIQTAPTNSHRFFALQPLHEPWINEHARHAFNAAYDRDAVVDVVYDNLHTPNHWGWLGPSTIYHDPDETFWEYDPELVRMHLDAGGLSDGFEFDMPVHNDPVTLNETEFIQAQLAEFGIKMNIQPRPAPDFWQGFFEGTDGGQFSGMSMRADIWQQIFWNGGAGAPYDHILPPDKDPELQAAFTKVAETFATEPRIEAMRELNRLMEARSWHIKNFYWAQVVAHDADLQYELFGDGKAHFGQNDVRWAT